MKELNLMVYVFLIAIICSALPLKNGKYFKYLPFLILFVFMAIRDDYGDGSNYRQVYEWVHQGGESTFELLYVQLMKICPSFQFLIAVESLFYVAGFYFVISKTLSYKQRSFALATLILHPYILMIDMSAIRQSIAIGLIIIGVYWAIKSEKLLIFVPFCFIAAFFHKSAIAVMPILLLFTPKPFSFKTKIALFITTLFLLMMPERLFLIVINALDFLELDNNNYLAYLNSGLSNSITAVVLSLLIMVFFFIFGDNVSGENAVFVKLSIISMMFEALQGEIQALGRIYMYFSPFLTFSLPMILVNSKENKKAGLTISIGKYRSVLSYETRPIIICMFIAVFVWKLVRFMTPQYAYRTIF